MEDPCPWGSNGAPREDGVVSNRLALAEFPSEPKPRPKCILRTHRDEKPLVVDMEFQGCHLLLDMSVMN